MSGETKIDIAATFQALYGYLPAQVPSFPPQPNDVNPYAVQSAAAKKTTTATGSPLYGLSDMIGREVFMPVTLTANGIDYDFPFCIVGLKTRKDMKITGMVERGGVVIEEISQGAWDIDLKGFLIDANGQFPDEQLAALNELYTNDRPVYLKCALTDIFMQGNDQVVIANLDIPAKAKVIGVRDFSFTMIQDSILDLFKVE